MKNKAIFGYAPNWGGVTGQGLNDTVQMKMVKDFVTKYPNSTVNIAFLAPIYKDADYCGKVEVVDGANGGIAFTDIWSDIQVGRDWNTAPSIASDIYVENAKAILSTDASYNIGGNPQPAYVIEDNTIHNAPIFEGLGSNKYLGSYGKLSQLANDSTKAGVSIGGWTRSDAFKYIASDAELTKKFLSSLDEFFKIYPKITSIDIDWEFPGKVGNTAGGYNNFAQNYATPDKLKGFDTIQGSDKEGFTKLIKALHQKFPEKTITAAVSPSPDAINNIDYSAIKDDIDYILLMAYDMHGVWEGKTGHNAPLHGKDDEISIHQAITSITATSFPSEKIVMGLPLYGRAFKGVENGQVGDFATQSSDDTSISYRDIKNDKLTNEAYQYHWDDDAKVPYLFNTNTKEWISYDDAKSFKAKIDYVKEHNLGGVMVWQIYQDTDSLELISTLDTLNI